MKFGAIVIKLFFVIGATAKKARVFGPGEH